jgi:3-deoxy-7-phosphoheptulonate synthase
VKVGPKATPQEVVELCDTLNPKNEPGKLILVTRLGVSNVKTALPPLLQAVQHARRRVLWVSDPMHGNQLLTRSGIKTRDFEDVLAEIELCLDVHERVGTVLGGVHFELTGDDVTECTGGGLTEEDLSRNYSTLCDPRLNYRQAIQMALSLAGRLATTPRLSSMPPPPSRRAL